MNVIAQVVEQAVMVQALAGRGVSIAGIGGPGFNALTINAAGESGGVSFGQHSVAVNLIVDGDGTRITFGRIAGSDAVSGEPLVNCIVRQSVAGIVVVGVAAVALQGNPVTVVILACRERHRAARSQVLGRTVAEREMIGVAGGCECCDRQTSCHHTGCCNPCDCFDDFLITHVCTPLLFDFSSIYLHLFRYRFKEKSAAALLRCPPSAAWRLSHGWLTKQICASPVPQPSSPLDTISV